MADDRDHKVPDGWTFVNEVQDKSNHPYYLCPATGQHFYTYEDLMRYVTYAKFEQLSIYAPDFNSKKKGKPRNSKRSKSAMKRKLPAKPKKRSRLLYGKPNFSADGDDQDGEWSSDSDSDPNDPTYLPRSWNARRRTNWKDQNVEKSSDSDSDSDSDPDDPPYLPGIEQWSRTDMKDQNGEKSSGSDSDRDYLPNLPTIGQGSSSQIRSEPDPPKIIMYQRRSKLKDQVNRYFVKIGRQ